MSFTTLTGDALRGLRPRRLADPTPGLALIGMVVAGAFALNRAVPSASPLLWAMGLGVLAAPFMHGRKPATAGIKLSATHLLRLGVALLGLRVSVGELAVMGLGGVAVAAGTIVSTLFATVWLGRRLGVPDKLALLIGTGSAICGASAIAAMDSVTRAREEHVGYAVATVTLFGTIAMLALPALSGLLGLTGTQGGMWAGGSVHEVAQSTAAGAVISAAALKMATLVKLCRVVLLAPVVAIVGGRAGERSSRSVRVPWFVVAFLVLVGVRSALPLPVGLLQAATVASTLLLASGLAALGLGVRVAALRAAGLRPLLLGLAAWGVAALTALGITLAVS